MQFTKIKDFCANPTTDGGMQNGSSVRILVPITHNARFRTFGADLHAQSLLVNKISASGAQSDVY